MKKIVQLVVCLAVFQACAQQPQNKATTNNSTMAKVTKTDEEWKKLLTDEQYYILRQKGTERAFTGKLNNVHEHGIFICAGCGNELFSSDTKYDSGSGWPSFYAPKSESSVAEHKDSTLGMIRTEIVCARCNGHLGHMFDDGPKPTGMRYCMNSGAMQFKTTK